jgi:hypothetical protein
MGIPKYAWLLGAMVARGPPKSEVVGSSPIVVVLSSECNSHSVYRVFFNFPISL